MATFIATSEGEIVSMIKNPGTLVQVFTIFKVFKATLIIMTFTFNGNVNDYFVSLFFWYSGMIGKFYFERVGLRSVEVNFSQTDLSFEINPDHMDNKNLSHYLDTVMALAIDNTTQTIRDKNTQMLQLITLVCFSFNTYLIFGKDNFF